MIRWTESKHNENFRKHGIDLADAERFDFVTALIEDDWESFGEQRFRAIGWIDDRLCSSSTPCAAMTRMSSASGTPPNASTGPMSNPSKVRLTSREQAEIAKRRAEARARARRIAATIPDKDDAAIRAAAEADPDNPPLRRGARLRPAHEVHPQLVAEQLRKRGRPRLEAPKRQVTLRLDVDVLEGVRATGPGWQTRVNKALRRWLQRQRRA
jgi:uncharacterized protein (DUF4415 family)